ncbi:MAG TPA: alanine--glyoxylate aminotransferase family protein [Bacteroidota bacterium]|jgi:aspartate aminotransferase-like enzyme|nr:alanine--glyoxylate aminotransferase family protein [Bacteroidota bacterium]
MTMMFKRRLFTPGPTPVPEKVMLKMAEPIIHHRSPEFNEIINRVNQNLKYLFQTSQPVLTLTCSGTGGVEATFVSIFSPGDTIISVNGGKFGERWVKMPRAFGLNVFEIKVEWGKSPTPSQIEEALSLHPGAKGVYLTHSETSTGAATDVRALSKIIRENSSALVCVDGITAIGAHELRFDEWGIDVCVTGSQKGLMIPPGLAFVALSERAIAAMATSMLPKYYLDLRKALKSYEANDTPWTPAASLIIGVDVALGMIRAEGIENVWERHKRMAEAIRSGVGAMGLKLFSTTPSYAVTPVWIPEGVEWNSFNAALKNSYGITVAGGQDEYAGRIFRISHLGYYDEVDMVGVIAALERALHGCGWKCEPGVGVRAAQQTLLSS